MTASSTGGTVDGPGAHGVTGDWTETGITWANKPATSAEPVSDSGAIADQRKGGVRRHVARAGQRPDRHRTHLDGRGRRGVPLARGIEAGSKFPVLEVTFGHPYDDKAPSVPADLIAEANGSNVNLGWTASTRQHRRDQLRDLPQRRPARRDRERHQLHGHDRSERRDVRVHRQGARQEREPLRREQHRVGDDARHAAPDPA